MRKLLSVILALALMASSSVVFAETPTAPVTKTELRTGVVFAWKNSAGLWQKGIQAGGIYNSTAPTTVDLKALYPNCTFRNISIKPYTGESLDGVDWYPNQFANDRDSYTEFYSRNAVSGLSIQNQSNPATGTMSYTYSGQLAAQDGGAIDVKWMLGQGGIDEIYAMLGYTAATAPAEYKTAMEELYPKGGQSSNVEGYLYFVPILRSYEVVPAARVLLPPDAWIECDVPTPYAGSAMPIESGITNKNDFEVGVTYTLSLNGTTLKTATTTIKAKGTLPVNASYKIPAKTKPGTLLNIKLTATIWDPENPAVKLSDTANCKRSVGIVDDSEPDGRLKPSAIVD